MDLLQEITKTHLRNDLPTLQTGEKVKVFISKNLESEKKENRFFSFQRIIIKKRKKKQLNYAFTVLNGDSKVIIKQIFFLSFAFDCKN